MSHYTLLTGSTGLLGRYLLKDLLITGQHVAVIARASERESVDQRIETIIQPWEAELGVSLPRPVCFEGDINQNFLNLDDPSRQWIAQHCTSVIHNAAALKFFEEANGEPWRTNVEGTRNVLQLCQDTSIKNLHYVSTAYVCGLCEGRIMEDSLDHGQGFRNDYEKSKHEAESLVRNDKHLDQVTVYRPAVIAGDSRTGYTNTYHGLFMYLQIMSVLARNTKPGPDGVRHTPLQLSITGDEPRNVIPVDWTSAVITHLFNTPESHGRTFHLAPKVKMTARQMIEAGCSFYNSTGVEFIGPSKVRSEEGMQRLAYDNSTMYREYEDSDPEFDMTNLDRFASHLPCPVIDQPMLHRFMAFGEQDRWGKRGQEPAQVLFQIERYLESLLNQYQQSIKSPAFEEEDWFGIEVLGAGGGQWTIEFAQNFVVSFKKGIHPDCKNRIVIDSDDFQRLAFHASSANREQLLEKLVESNGSMQRSLINQFSNALFPEFLTQLVNAK